MFDGTLKLLLLAGGQSTRMGRDKFLLTVFDRPLYVHLLEEMQHAFPTAKSAHLSFHTRHQAEAAEIDPKSNIRVILDEVSQWLGPAAGLLAAYRLDPTAHWAVVACDYPLMIRSELGRLLDEFREPLTCFRNSDGFVEPLVGIWSPTALSALKINVSKGRLGPSNTFKQLRGTLVAPSSPQSLLNANTEEEWESALQILAIEHSQ